MSNKYDHKGRIRNKVAAFRISEEENQMLDWKVAMSAQAKSDYIIGCILDKEKTVTETLCVLEFTQWISEIC